MNTIKETWTVLGQTFDSKELAKAYLDKEEKIKKASQDLHNLLNFQKKKANQSYSLNQISFSNQKDFAKFLLENSLELQKVMKEYKL
tara:strand:- start:57 stop:317 length:261 start_codon:yes stop_codon:yes gene_type:complete